MSINNKSEFSLLRQSIREGDIKYFDFDNVILSLGVISDTHIGDPRTKESMLQGIEYITKLKGSLPDAFLHIGDLSNSAGHGNFDQITAFRGIYLAGTSNSVPLIYCLGPTHDMCPEHEPSYFRAKFAEYLGEVHQDNDIFFYEGIGWAIHHKTLKGFDFLVFEYSGGCKKVDFTEADGELVRAKVKECLEKNPNRYIFALVHSPWPDGLIDVFKDFPQVICFSGHTHNSISREDAISQDSGYTKMHCGGLNYYRVTGYTRFRDNPYLSLGDIHSFGQEVMVLVDKNESVLIVRLDCIRERVIHPSYEVNKENFGAYTVARFEKGRTKFADDAKLKIKRVGENKIEISFSPSEYGPAGPAIYYTATVYQNEGGEYVEKTVLDFSSQEVYYPNAENIPEFIVTHEIEDVDLSDFAITVTATDCRGRSRNSLCYTNGSFESPRAVVGENIIEL